VTGGNVAVRVTNEGVLIVDDKFPPASAEIAPKVRSVTSQPIRYVLSTHNHGDHTGGHPEFIKTAEIIAHRNARDNMVNGKQPAPPRIVFNDQAAVFVGGIEVQARYLGRGHTNGDSVIYFPDLRTVHTGDLVVWGKRTDGTVLTPFMDYANGGSLIEWIGTLDKLLQMDFDAAIPGHGPVLTKDDVRAFRQKLMTLRQRGDDLIRTGITRNDFLGKLRTDDLNWPFPKERIEPLYDELAARR
jgi:glyoxylase-like metal-dependent hydrolase (beta-lactamase superfamily II)